MSHPVTSHHTEAAKLLSWYDANARVLPWRVRAPQKADPYAVFLSEIMLQQTTVKAVIPYFENFLARWPNVTALAEADQEDVLRQWAGLGYYSRARNLHACAQNIAFEHQGAFPAHEVDLAKLPGIGPYTAAAISSIAFGCRAVVVDGNVERVISRIFALEEPLPKVKKTIREKAETLTPEKRAGDYAQAMMDLGATICTPKNPSCILCPWSENCEARKRGDAASFPRRAAKAERPTRYGAAFYIEREDGAVLLRSRPQKGLLGGMTEVPSTPWIVGTKDKTPLSHAPLEAKFSKATTTVTHVFSHFALELDVYRATVPNTTQAPEGSRWVDAKNVDAEALPSVMRKVIEVGRGR